LGRTKGRRRLAEFACNMADDLLFINANEEIAQILSEFERPIHRNVCMGKVLCPNEECISRRDFFLENGICHHLRIRHKQEFTSEARDESIRICKMLHEQETRECMDKIFDYRRIN
jgi:hypothetical protein